MIAELAVVDWGLEGQPFRTGEYIRLEGNPRTLSTEILLSVDGRDVVVMAETTSIPAAIRRAEKMHPGGRLVSARRVITEGEDI